jgi:hypothetical protein
VTDKEWDPKDYLFDFADVPAYEGELVAMPIHHKMEKLRKYLVHDVLSDMERAQAADAPLSAVLLGLASIDYLAGYYAGKQSKKPEYVDFMRRYFPSAHQPYLEAFYDQLRSGLMHNLVAMNPWKPNEISFTIHRHSDNHLAVGADGKIDFSVGHLRVDIFRAWRMWAFDLIMKPDKNEQEVRNFHRRFNKYDGVGAYMEETPNQIP